MRVLLVPIAGQGFALDAGCVERVESDAAENPREDLPEIDLRSDRLAGEGEVPSRVVFRTAGMRVALRTGVPLGFCEVEAARLAPLPAFLFREDRRLARAVFEHDGRTCLLLDEAVLATIVSDRHGGGLYLTFRSGGADLAVPLAASREVLPSAAPLPLPGARPGVRGILLRDGVAIPIVDLAALASGRATPPDGEQAVMLEAGEAHLGLLVAGVDAAPAEDVPSSEEEAPRGWTWVAGRVMVRGRAFWVLEPEAVMQRLAGPDGGGER